MKCKTFTCIVCPNGCSIDSVQNADGEIQVTGHRCKRGKEYVLQELTDPRRTIATTVRISGGMLPLCSVRLDRAIPKRDIFRVMEEIGRVRLEAPVRIGQVVIADVCGTGASVIVTKNMNAI